MIDKEISELKKEFRTLVRKIKFLMSDPNEEEYTNEKIALRSGIEYKYFNTLTGKSGKVLQEHIDKLKTAYPECNQSFRLTSDSSTIQKYVEVLEENRKLLKEKRLIEDAFEKRLATVEATTQNLQEFVNVFLPKWCGKKQSDLKTAMGITANSVNQRLKPQLKTFGTEHTQADEGTLNT